MIQQPHFQVLFQRKQKHYVREIYVLHAHCRAVRDCQDMEATWGPLTEEGMEKMWYTHTHRENVTYP